MFRRPWKSSHSDPGQRFESKQLLIICMISVNYTLTTIVSFLYSAGDKKIHVPVLEPLQVNEISVDPSDTFHMGLKNISVYGLGKSMIRSAQ